MYISKEQNRCLYNTYYVPVDIIHFYEKHSSSDTNHAHFFMTVVLSVVNNEI